MKLTKQPTTKDLILKASAKGFQRTKTLVAKYGLDAAMHALECIEIEGHDRMRVYGAGGGIGPGAK